MLIDCLLASTRLVYAIDRAKVERQRLPRKNSVVARHYFFDKKNIVGYLIISATISSNRNGITPTYSTPSSSVQRLPFSWHLQNMIKTRASLELYKKSAFLDVTEKTVV